MNCRITLRKRDLIDTITSLLRIHDTERRKDLLRFSCRLIFHSPLGCFFYFHFFFCFTEHMFLHWCVYPVFLVEQIGWDNITMCNIQMYFLHNVDLEERTFWDYNMERILLDRFKTMVVIKKKKTSIWDMVLYTFSDTLIEWLGYKWRCCKKLLNK